jgi:hypothetical protein
MPYYTYHKHKGAHHYVCIDVLSVFSLYWIPYYILYMNIDADPYIYHRNICILHCVREVHSKYPGKHTKVKH